MKPLSDFFYDTNVENMGPDMIAPAAKKLWDKGPGAGGDNKGGLPPLQLNPEQMWRDPTWSAQVEHGVGGPMMGGRRGGTYPGGDANSILSPRDTTGLGVKMVLDVLGGSPTGANVEKVAGVVAGLRNMVLEERPEDKTGAAASPFEKDLHELHDTLPNSMPNGLHNGQDDDKAFNFPHSRTPGSRQPSPAEEEAVAGAVGARGLEPTAFPLLPPHAVPQPLHHMPHMSHPTHQHHPGMLGVAPIQGLPHPQHPQIHPGMTLNDSMNQHLELVLQMEQHPQFDNNNFANSQQYGGVGGVGGVGGSAGSMVNGAAPDNTPHHQTHQTHQSHQTHQPFDVQVTHCSYHCS